MYYLFKNCCSIVVRFDRNCTNFNLIHSKSISYAKFVNN
jgi:hypothetical protein